MRSNKTKEWPAPVFCREWGLLQLNERKAEWSQMASAARLFTVTWQIEFPLSLMPACFTERAAIRFRLVFDVSSHTPPLYFRPHTQTNTRVPSAGEKSESGSSVWKLALSLEAVLNERMWKTSKTGTLSRPDSKKTEDATSFVSRNPKPLTAFFSVHPLLLSTLHLQQITNKKTSKILKMYQDF